MIEEFARLREPIPKDEILWRILRYGWKDGKPWALIVPYFDARYAMERLDEIFGPHGWCDDAIAYEHGVICKVTVFVEVEADAVKHTRSVSKTDGAQYSDVEGFKGAHSDAFKRACVKLGLGRELYGMKNVWAETSTSPQKGWEKVYDKSENKPFWWRPPSGDSPPASPPERQQGKPKGDYDKAFQAIYDARDFETLNKLEQMVDTREWTDSEYDNITKKIQKQKILIQEGYYAE
jgi:hypothetical protein